MIFPLNPYLSIDDAPSTPPASDEAKGNPEEKEIPKFKIHINENMTSSEQGNFLLEIKKDETLRTLITEITYKRRKWTAPAPDNLRQYQYQGRLLSEEDINSTLGSLGFSDDDNTLSVSTLPPEDPKHDLSPSKESLGIMQPLEFLHLTALPLSLILTYIDDAKIESLLLFDVLDQKVFEAHWNNILKETPALKKILFPDGKIKKTKINEEQRDMLQQLQQLHNEDKLEEKSKSKLGDRLQALEKLSPDILKNPNRYLLMASREQDYLQFKLALLCKAKVNTLDENKDTPLMLACISGNYQIVKSLLNHKAKVNYTNYTYYKNYTNDTNGTTALSLACQNAHAEIVKLLLNHQAKTHCVDFSGNSPLLLVCGQIHPFTSSNRIKQESLRHIAEQLLVHGASVNFQRRSGETPLILICKNKADDMVPLLLRYGASKDELRAWQHYDNSYDKGNYERSPLMIACKENKYEKVEQLLAHRADVNYVTIVSHLISNDCKKFHMDLEITALLEAAQTPNAVVNIVKILLAYGAEITHTLKNALGELKDKEIQDLLVAHYQVKKEEAKTMNLVLAPKPLLVEESPELTTEELRNLHSIVFASGHQHERKDEKESRPRVIIDVQRSLIDKQQLCSQFNKLFGKHSRDEKSKDKITVDINSSKNELLIDGIQLSNLRILIKDYLLESVSLIPKPATHPLEHKYWLSNYTFLRSSSTLPKPSALTPEEAHKLLLIISMTACKYGNKKPEYFELIIPKSGNITEEEILLDQFIRLFETLFGPDWRYLLIDVFIRPNPDRLYIRYGDCLIYLERLIEGYIKKPIDPFELSKSPPLTYIELLELSNLVCSSACHKDGHSNRKVIIDVSQQEKLKLCNQFRRLFSEHLGKLSLEEIKFSMTSEGKLCIENIQLVDLRRLIAKRLQIQKSAQHPQTSLQDKKHDEKHNYLKMDKLISPSQIHALIIQLGLLKLKKDSKLEQQIERLAKLKEKNPVEIILNKKRKR